MHEQQVTITRTLSYAPQCSGNEQTLSSCIATQPTIPCSLIALISCSNESTAILTTTTNTIISATLPTYSYRPHSFSSSFTATLPTFIYHPHPTLSPSTTRLTSPAETLAALQSTMYVTPSPPNSDDAAHNEKRSPSVVLYVLLGSATVAGMGVALLASVLVCRSRCSRGRKGPAVEELNFDISISNKS